ncbi:conserved oligomeric Golgi complex subunit 1-like [Penaeus japonicus]|uniref:conserved oligomeric Golgi complex subunit 1-like n=1 Tax=Penaeus japonicus TaxID=27405 RepID=UPI001C713E4D|nr:conserved oligomeric Golgi complex subunit 1-like [Penaeus japonicus]XP_042883133.1 conserved oligomeric Golgi complex subunit 1-like [Penaeus japonicus]
MPAVTAEDDVTLLFERHTVVQVQDILKKTRSDIEKKKEDLRVMVGERYRDLIEAADTISEMRNSAEAICGNIHTMEGLCESLQQRGLIGFKTQSHHSNGSLRSPTPGSHYSVAVQVKLLVAVPEILWSLTERCHYLPATQLLLLAHHTHTALQLAPNASKIQSWFPVIERQWASISQFRATIVRGCSNLISSEVDDVQAVLDAVVSVMLVEGCTSTNALSRVLQLRHGALMSAVTPKPSATAKAQISQFVTLFLATLNIIHAIFGKGKEGQSLLEKRLQEMVQGEGEDGAPIAHLQESLLTLSFLPQSIRNFRPSVSGHMDSLSDDILKKQVTDWLNLVLKEASHALGVLLSFSTTIKALAMIRTSVWEICQAKVEKEQWKKTTDVLYGSYLDPWDSVVRGQVTERARQVITSQLTNAKEAIVQMVAKLADDIIADPKICSEEGDITSFVWSESAGDLPERVGWTCASSRSVTQAGGLYYKTRGYTSRLQTICRALNSRLTALLQDVGHYSSGSANGDLCFVKDSPVGDEDLSAKEDYTALLNFLQDTSSSVFTQLMLELENLAKHHMAKTAPRVQDGWEEDSEGAALTVPSTILVVIGRVCLALPNVCPQMQMCASAASLANPDVARRISMGSKLETDSWTKMRSEFQGTSGRLFGLFLTSLTSHLGTEVKTFLTTELSSGGVAAAISSFPTWEMVDIEEEGEGGNIVKSSIHVPAHPSPALTQALSRLCTSVNCVAAHTITRNAQSELASSACEVVTSAYEVALNDAKEINQTLALQLIFDLRFIQTILLPRDSKNVGSQLTTMIQDLEAKVDPFDLDVFTPHISSRVKLAAHRVQVVLGAILSRDRQVVTGRAPSVGSSATTSNNALPIVQAVEIPRFSNVPLPLTLSRPTIHTSITTPNLSANVNEGLSLKLSSTKDQSSPSSARREMSSAALSASRSAASLLSAMSSSWFGSSSSSS